MNVTYVTVWPYPPHLINVATLSCESQDTENVILQLVKCNITVSVQIRGVAFKNPRFTV